MQNFFQKNLYTLGHNFCHSHIIFLAFLCINIFQTSNFAIIFHQKLKFSFKKPFFNACQFLVFLVCFPCEEFLVMKFLDSSFLMRNCDAYWNYIKCSIYIKNGLKSNNIVPSVLAKLIYPFSINNITITLKE